MKKEDIAARLTAAGITFPASANKAALEQLAQENNVDLSEPPGTPEEPAQEEATTGSSVEEWAKTEVEALKEAPAPAEISEEQIREKTAAGLTREQAIEVLQAQARHDAELAASKGKA